MAVKRFRCHWLCMDDCPPLHRIPVAFTPRPALPREAMGMAPERGAAAPAGGLLRRISPACAGPVRLLGPVRPAQRLVPAGQQGYMRRMNWCAAP